MKFHVLLSGFRKKHGCKNILAKLTEDWRHALDNNMSIGAIAIDLSKAFDCMPHGLLLAKLNMYGVDLHTCQLIKSYLLGRKQRVKIGSKTSSWVTAIKGVPQGSILGPLLFNIFINDLMYIDMESTVYNYADDNTISYIHHDIDTIKRILTGDAMKAIAWFKDNMMKANPDKFQVMFLGKDISSTTLSIELGNVKISGAASINILGIEIDDCLKFDICTKNMCTKIAKQINALLRIKNDLDIYSRRTLYNSYIASNLNYCSIVWMFMSRSNLKKLDKLNERALRMIFNDSLSTYAELLLRNKSMDIYKGCIKSLCVEMYRIRNGLSPSYMQNLFSLKINNCYSLRDNNIFEIPKFKSKRYGYHSMSYIGAKLWSNIDIVIKDINKLKTFKSEVIKWLLQQTNYECFVNTYF